MEVRALGPITQSCSDGPREPLLTATLGILIFMLTFLEAVSLVVSKSAKGLSLAPLFPDPASI